MVDGITGTLTPKIIAWTWQQSAQTELTRGIINTANSALKPAAQRHAAHNVTAQAAKDHAGVSSVASELADSRMDNTSHYLSVRTTPQRCDRYQQLLHKCGLGRLSDAHAVKHAGYQVVSRAGQLELRCYIPKNLSEHALDNFLAKAQQLFHDERIAEKNLLALLAEKMLDSREKMQAKGDEFAFVRRKLQYCDLHNAVKELRKNKAASPSLPENVGKQ